MPSGFMFFGNVSLVGFGSFFAMFPSDALGVSGIDIGAAANVRTLIRFRRMTSEKAAVSSACTQAQIF